MPLQLREREVFGCAAAVWLLDRDARDVFFPPTVHTGLDLGGEYFAWLEAARSVLKASGALLAGRKTRMPRLLPSGALRAGQPLDERFECVQRSLDLLRAATKDPTRWAEALEAARTASPGDQFNELVALALLGSSRPFEADTTLASTLKRHPRAKNLKLVDWPDTRELALPHVPFHNNSGGIAGVLFPLDPAQGPRDPWAALLRLAVDDGLREGEWEEMEGDERVDWFVEDFLLGERDWKPLSWFDTLNALFDGLAGNRGQPLLLQGEGTSLPQLLSDLGPFEAGAVCAPLARQVFQFQKALWVEWAVL